MSKLKIGVKILFLLSFVSALNAQKTEIQLIKKTVVGGEGGWDYVAVSSELRQLYLAHGNQVEVLNADTHEKLGIVSNTKGVHGVAVAAKLERGFASNGKTNTVSVFDTKTFKVLSEIPAGKNPDALFFDELSGRVFVFNNKGGSATVIDAASASVVGTVELGGDPEAGAIDENGIVFVNLEDKNEIVSFDGRTLKIKNRWRLEGGEEPSGLALDTKNHRLFSVCRNKLMLVLDAQSGKTIAKLPIGERVDGVVFDAANQLAISSNGEGTMTVVKEISPTDFRVLETVRTAPGARTIGIDNKTSHVFLVSAQFGDAPAATAQNPKPRRSTLSNTFTVMEYGK